MKTLATVLFTLILAGTASAKCSSSCNGTEVVTNGCSHKQIEGLKDICGGKFVTTTTIPNLGGPAPTTTTTLPSAGNAGAVDCYPTLVETRVKIDHCRHYNVDATKGFRCTGHLGNVSFPCKGYATWRKDIPSKGVKKGDRRTVCTLAAY